MTIKQLIVGTMLGATAFGTMLHRLPKQPDQNLKPQVQMAAAKTGPRATRAPRKQVTPERLSLSKVYG